MKALEAWLAIVENCKDESVEILTDKKLRDIPQWFAATSNGFLLMLSEAPFKTPRAKFIEPVIINRQEFEMIFPYYFKQERVSKMTGIWLYQDYIFAVIKHFCFTENTELNMMLNDDESEKDSVSNTTQERFTYIRR